jgi:hypothetical protein
MRKNVKSLFLSKPSPSQKERQLEKDEKRHCKKIKALESVFCAVIEQTVNVYKIPMLLKKQAE